MALPRAKSGDDAATFMPRMFRQKGIQLHCLQPCVLHERREVHASCCIVEVGLQVEDSSTKQHGPNMRQQEIGQAATRKGLHPLKESAPLAPAAFNEVEARANLKSGAAK